MGCCCSRAPRQYDAEESTQGDESSAPAASVSGGHVPRPSRGQRQNNVVPMPEGLFTGRDGTASSRGSRPAIVQGPSLMQDTQTVRSLVNLQKHSLQLLKDEGSGSPGRYRLSFVADSSVPCRALVYLMAYEKDQGTTEAPPRLKSRVTRKEPSVALPVSGLKFSYTMPVGQGLNLATIGDDELPVEACALSHVYPLVIRLLVLPTAGEKASGSSVLQSQTTFATFAKQADGSLEVTVVKQVMWLHGACYVLHEIFGIDRSPEEAGDGAADGKECVICMAEQRDTLCLPCRHMCLCSDCAKALRFQSNKCPICRCVVHSLLHILLAEAAGADESTGSADAPSTPAGHPPGRQLALDRTPCNPVAEEQPLAEDAGPMSSQGSASLGAGNHKGTAAAGTAEGITTAGGAAGCDVG